MNGKRMYDPVKPKVHKKSWVLLRALFSRTALMLIFFIIQVGFLYTIFRFLNDKLAYGVFVALAFIETIIIVNKSFMSSNLKIAWIVPILVVPVFGGLFYLYYNMQSSIKIKRRVLDHEIRVSRPQMRQDIKLLEELDSEKNDVGGLSRYLYDACGFPTFEGSEAVHFPDGAAFFESLFSELEKAERFIFLEYFIISIGSISDSFFNILREKAKAGVEIYLIYDGTNDVKNLPIGFEKKLNGAGIHTKIFSQLLPILESYQNHRDHRKICVIDGLTAFTGGINIADEYANIELKFGTWKDSGIMLKGSCVNSFSVMFIQMWNSIRVRGKDPGYIRDSLRLEYQDYYITRKAYREKCASDPVPRKIDASRNSFIIPYADSPLDKERVGENVYSHIINTANKYVFICSPYLILDDQIMRDLLYARKRGVDVKIMLPHIPDKPYAFWLAHAYYFELIQSGVEIYEYMPGFVHTKEFISDDIRGVIGTINLDYRSLYLHFENAVFLYNLEAVANMKREYAESLKYCELITLEKFRSYPKAKLFVGSLLKILAPLF